MKQSKVGFWDTSALLPLFCRDQFSVQSRELVRKYPEIVIWWGTPVEIRAAFMRLLQGAHMSAENVQKALSYFAEFRLRWREVLPVERVRELAEDCCDRYRVRSADSLQLGAALVWCKEHPKGKNFICFDPGLLEAARQAGFIVNSRS